MKSLKLLSVLVALFVAAALVSCSDEVTEDHVHTFKNGVCTGCAVEQSLDELSGKELANAIFLRSDKAMNSLDSYRGEMTESFSCTLGGRKTKIEATADIVELAVNSPDYLSYMKMTVKAYSGSTLVQTTVQENGYTDGYYYISQTEGNDEKVLLRSSVTKDGYKKNRESGAAELVGLTDSVLTDAKNVNASKQADGSWLVSYSSYNYYSLKKFAEAMSDVTYFLPTSLTLEDVNFSFTATAGMLITDVKIEYKFKSTDDTEALPSIVMNATFRDHGKASYREDVFVGKAVEVGDLMALEAAYDAYTDMLFSGNLAFKAKLVIDNGSDVKLAQTSGSCIKTAVGFSHTYTSGAQTLSYENGKLALIVDGKTVNTVTTDDSTEKVRFYQYSDVVMFDIFSAESCKVEVKDGVSTYTVGIDSSRDVFYKTLKNQYQSVYIAGGIDLTLVVKDGKLISVNYSIAERILPGSAKVDVTVEYAPKI